MRTEPNPALSGDQIEGALVKIRKIPGQSFRRTKIPTHRLHGIGTAAERMYSRSGKLAEQWQMTQDWMLNLHLIVFTPFPLAEIRWHAGLFQRVLHGRSQQTLVIVVAR